MPAPVVQDRDGGGTTTSVGSAARRCGERRAIATGGSRRRRWAAEHITERLPPKKRAPPPILRPGLDHVAALAEGREAGVGVVRGVVIAVCDGQDRPGPAVEDVGFCRDPEAAAPVHRATGRLPRPTSDHPATIAEGVDHSRPYGRPQPLRQSSACPNRLTSESWGQPMGLKKRCSGRIGTAGLKIRCGA